MMTEQVHTVHLVKYAEALRAARGLVLFRRILKDPICLVMVRFLEAVTTPAQPDEILDAFGELFFLLSEKVEEAGEPVGDAWQNFLLNRILYDDNAFSRGAAAASFEKLGISLRAAAEGDLRKLQTLHRVDAVAARETVLFLLGEGQAPVGGLPVWEDIAGCDHHPVPLENRLGREIKAAFCNLGDWGRCLEELAGYYRQAGAGLFGQYGAFRWVSPGGCLEGIAEPDAICFEELIGYQSQRQEVAANTERFLAGLPANNLLLYGDRGTGKSSTIKALLSHYGGRGLRLVEISKNVLGEFPSIIRQLRERPQRFILFVDDLSFEESEVGYKELKSVLEGSLESRPSNVLIYATSNRRHLVRERFSDREPVSGQDGDVRGNDTIQEKLSLADRFGVTILFTTPDRALYLDIVRGLAQQRGLSLEDGELERRALLWEAWQNGRSGRTARQFIDHISGEPG